MITRNFNLYLNAGTNIAPIINASQFDQGEEWIFTLLTEDGTVYTPSTGAIIGLKTDGTTILNAGTVNEDGQVVITETEQMTAVPGSNIFEILIDGNSHGTANFVVFVERRPGDIDNPSESDISLFQEAIEAAGNVTQFQADISALQSGLSQETQTRQSQDTSLASQIAQEANARSQQDAVLQAEIDQIIAPSGEAPSAAEVQNARIGVDGTTYDTLGNAIRGQVSDLKNALSQTKENLNGTQYVLAVDLYKDQNNRFIYRNDNKVYLNEINGFTLKAYKIYAGKKYACNGSVISPFSFNYGLVLMGICYTDSDISFGTGYVFTFSDSVVSNANENLNAYSYSFEAQSNGYIIMLEVEDKYSNSVISETDSTNVNQRIEELETNSESTNYVLTANPSSDLLNAFIYDADNKVYANTLYGFKIKAYRIRKGQKYSCIGKSTASFSFNQYDIVLFGICYSASEIELKIGTIYNFSYKLKVQANIPFSGYEYEFEAQDDGYIIMMDVADAYANTVLSIESLNYDRFDSLEKQIEETNEKIQRRLSTLFNADFENTDFYSMANWELSNGKLLTSVSDISNKAVVDKSYSIEERTTAIRFKTSDATAKIGFGYISTAYAYGSTLCYVDFSTGKMAICEAYHTPETMPDDRVTKSITLSTNREYIAVLEKTKKKNAFTIIDTLTGARNSIETFSESTSTLLNEFAGGRQNGRPFAVLLSGNNAEITEWYVTTPFSEPRIAVYGDSITEGDRLTNNQKRFSDWLKEDFGYYNVSVSGMSGSNIDTVTAQIQNEIPYTKPDIVIVGIGTNGTITESKLNALKSVIETSGAIAIFDHIPMLSGPESQTKNAIIDLINTQHALMDVATAVNNNPADGQNSTLFADGIHPNESGHKEMYERFVIDSSIYHD